MNLLNKYKLGKKMKTKKFVITAIVASAIVTSLISCNSTDKTKTNSVPKTTFVVTDSLQTVSYDDAGNVIEAPSVGEAFYGQDAQYTTTLPSYTDNDDGTVTDNNTGLMWQQTPPDHKMTYDEAVEYVDSLTTGGYTDWRLPTIQESFTLANLDGKLQPEDIESCVPYIDTEYFGFFYDENKPYTGSYWTSSKTIYMEDLADNTGNNNEMERSYGFNWADGHLKSYADGHSTVDATSTGFSIPAGVRAVRGEEGVIGANDYQDNADGTVSDNATGLMWSQTDAADGMDWEAALNYAENSELAGYSDWRLPTPKELQTLVEYEKPTIPAIDTDYFTFHLDDCYVWSSTTSGDFPQMADYVTFGHGWGIEIGQDNTSITTTDFDDVHAPGCIRADYKSGTAPELSQEFYEQISGVTYPGTEFVPGESVISGSVVEDNTGDGLYNEFDLTFSENAADYIVIYNRVMLVRDMK
jgi:hypothetical protein